MAYLVHLMLLLKLKYWSSVEIKKL
nr:unnamed protein product [Callosobruchus chinensis]CAH7716157.1 unnamed protein product [Callosobruchus chinensis]CAH7722587.1 unnamed protein product [Callosobruchus chinensis]